LNDSQLPRDNHCRQHHHKVILDDCLQYFVDPLHDNITLDTGIYHYGCKRANIFSSPRKYLQFSRRFRQLRHRILSPQQQSHQYVSEQFSFTIHYFIATYQCPSGLGVYAHYKLSGDCDFVKDDLDHFLLDDLHSVHEDHHIVCALHNDLGTYLILSRENRICGFYTDSGARNSLG